MHIEFDYIKFKNILSYGNGFTTVKFNKGLNLISASNGSGKSTILDALSYGLFDKPYRPIKKANLINFFNQKEMVVEIAFKTGNDSYVLTRGCKPDVLKLTKNGKALDILSSKKLNQEEIDKIVGIDYNLFKSVMAVATVSNKPFFSLSAAERRALTESIFNIDVIALMLKAVKKRDSVNKQQQKLNLSTFDSLSSRIIDNKAYIDSIDESKRKFDEANEAIITEATSSITTLETEKKAHEKNVGIGKKKIVEYEAKVTSTSDLISEKTKIEVQISTNKTKVNEAKRKLENFDGKVACPICSSPLDGEHAKAHIAELEAIIEELTNAEPALLDQKKILIDKINEADSIKKKLDTIKLKTREEEIAIETCDKQIARKEKLIEDTKAKTFDMDVSSYKEKLVELTERKATIESDIDKLDSQLSLDSSLIEILGDNGIKTFFFNKLLPALNSRVNAYLKKFNLPVEVKFNELLDAEIMYGRVNREYMSFSGGERARLDMSVLLSFFDISRSISNWSSSILFIDEVLDAGVDAEGIDSFIATLYNTVNGQTNGGLGVYVISHKLAEANVNWDEEIKITKNGGFSELKQGKE